MSPQILKRLPDIRALKRLCQSLAMLDAIFEPEWDLRYFSFNSHWAQGQEMASMRNGSGDDYFILFSTAGAIIKGYAHESHLAAYFVEHDAAWPGVLDAVPVAFADFLEEPAFEASAATFCFWRQNSDPAWQMGPVVYPDAAYPDGADDLLFALDNDPQTYQAWAEEYHGQSVSLGRVKEIYSHVPLTQELVTGLNPLLTLGALAEDLAEIDYPIALGDS